ncbi:MAG: DNA polymerase III subunit beta [Patescibacteria group bacterium]|nr:DNA polymerase III subunit beta [Patescibacteria group bacterium]
MELTFLKEHLINQLHLLTRITGYNTTLPILSSVYLEARKGGLVLKATNLEMGVILNIRASVKKTGKIAVPAKILSNVMEGISEKKITIKKSGNNIKISTGTCNNEIKGVESKDFPLIPQVGKNIFLKMKGKDLARAIEQVIPSIAISNMRPDLAGVYILRKKGEVKVVATDGFRLSERTIKQKIIKKSKKKISNALIIPGKTAVEIIHIFNQREEVVSLLVEENQIAVKCENIYLVSRVIDGNYPDYTQIIPKEYKTEIILDKNELLGAVKLAALFSQADSNDILLDIQPSNRIMNVSAQSKDTGKTLKKVKIKASGKKVKIVLNYKYLTDSINSIKEDELRILINQNDSPILIEPNKERGKNFLCIISPINKQ